MLLKMFVGDFMKNNYKLKIQFYIISLLILFVLNIVVDFKLKDCNNQFMSINELISSNIFSIICFAFIIIGIIFLINQRYVFNGTKNPCCKIIKIENENYEVLTFISTYIIPPICFNFENIRYKIIFFVLLFIIGIVFIKMDLYLANPVLAMFGYRLYRIDTDIKKGISVITKDNLKKGDSIDWIDLDDTSWYVKRRDNERRGNEIKNK